MATLFDLLYQVASTINVVTEGTATGGTTGTLIDTNGLTQPDGYYNAATCFIIYDAGGAGAAPQGQFSQVATYVLSTKTLTFRVAPEPVFTAAPASGDRYALSAKRYPLDKLIQFTNAALQDLGVIPYTDATLTSAGNKTEYALPSALANMDLRQVWEQTVTSDSDDNRYQMIHSWRVIPAAIGAAATLVLPQLTAGHKILLVYANLHPTLRVYGDKLSELVHPSLVVYPAALKALMWYKAKTQESGVYFNEQVNFIQHKIDEAQRARPLRLPQKQGQILVVGNDDLPPRWPR